MKSSSITLALTGVLVSGTLAKPQVGFSASTINKRAAICGAKGYDNGQDSYWDSMDGDYDACSLACVQEIQCQSFAYGSGACYLFDVAVADNFEVDSESPYAFYDITCPDPTKSIKSSEDQVVLGKAMAALVKKSTIKPSRKSKRSKKRSAQNSR